jgi:hypothetical protein
MSSTLQQKYRPCLSALQIAVILDTFRSLPVKSAEHISVMQVLSPFIAKIQCGAITPAHTAQARAQDKVDMLAALASTPNVSSRELGYELGGYDTVEIPTISKEQWWAQCYEHYCAYLVDPVNNPITPEQLHAANEHRYLNDLMTAQEIQEFESLA